MNRRRAKALRKEVFVSFGRGQLATKDIVPCCTCGGEANAWPSDDDPTPLYGAAEVRRGDEVVIFNYDGGEWSIVPICETCFASQPETSNKLMRMIFGDSVLHSKPVEVSEETMEAMLDKPEASEH
jgi:hypothetical protein